MRVFGNAEVTSERTSNSPEIAGTTENGAALERKMLQNRALEAARLSRTRALWSSGSVLLGSWAGSLGLATVATRINSISLPSFLLIWKAGWHLFALCRRTGCIVCIFLSFSQCKTQSIA